MPGPGVNSSYVKNGQSQRHSSLLAVRAMGSPRILVWDDGGRRGLHSKVAEEIVEDVVVESEEVFVGAGVRSSSGSGSNSSGTYFTATEEEKEV